MVCEKKHVYLDANTVRFTTAPPTASCSSLRCCENTTVRSDPRPLQKKHKKYPASTNLSNNILTPKIPKASRKAVNKCPALGYSTPGDGSARSAQVTLWGSQNRSFQNQAERAAMFHRVSVHGWLKEVQFLSERNDEMNSNVSPDPGPLCDDDLPHSTLPHRAAVEQKKYFL